MHNTKAIAIWLFFFLFLYAGGTAQQYDKVWAQGSYVTTLAFDNDSVELGRLADSTTLSFVTMASICDENGNFLFYSNGLAVYNRFGNIMPNGDSLSFPSEYYSQQQPGGMASMEGVVILPRPNNVYQYYIFHFTATDTDLVLGGYEALSLYYSIVDIRSDSGRGDLIAKNIPVIQNELLSGSRLSACRHANGRDWWIVKPAWHENIYYSLLLTPDSVEGPFIQQIGPLYGASEEIAGCSAFSPDGSKYASVTAESYVVVMDFDRCTGLFSNPDSFYNNDSNDPLNQPISGGVSLAFSASGRFLYVNNSIELNQYDLWSSHIHDSIRIETDTIEPYQMGTLQLASNGKMYVSCWAGGSYKIHVINHPDSLGLNCDFRLLGQSVLSANSTNLPYFPNFRLGALIGSGCDTINGILDVGAMVFNVTIEPNPASNIVSVIYLDNRVKVNTIDLYDYLGHLVLTKTNLTNSGRIEFDVSALPVGVYIVRFTADSNELLNSKLVVVK